MTQSLRPLIRQLIRESELDQLHNRVIQIDRRIADLVDASEPIYDAIDAVQDAAGSGWQELLDLHGELALIDQERLTLAAERDRLRDQLHGPGWRRYRRGA